MLNVWLNNCRKMLAKHYMTILMAAAIISLAFALATTLWEAAFWKHVATTPEPELCAICEDGNGLRYHAPALINLNTGKMRELEIYDSAPTRPWEVAENQRWDDWVFSFIDENAAMSWSAEDHTNIAHIGENLDRFTPALFCHDCRVLLAETDNEGYALLDLYDLEDIQAFAIEDGAEYTIRDYTVSIYKDKENSGLSVEVTGHLFGAE